MKKSIRMVINGFPWEGDVQVNRTLLEFLREDQGLTGPKQGCDGGECGACVVMLNGKPVQSCLILAAELDGSSVTTIEGLNDDLTRLIEEAYVEVGAVQCGFCAPGMVMATRALLEENPNPTPEDINNALVGHLCRCTGYIRTVEAIDYVVGRLNEKCGG